MPNCDKFVSLFSEYLDSNLSSSKKESFEQHLQQCSDCAETLQQMRALKTQLKQLPKVQTSDAFHVVLHSRIRRELDRETVWERLVGVFQTHRISAYSAVAAAAVVILFLSYSTLFHSDEVPIPTQNFAQQRAAPAATLQQPIRQQNEQIYFVLEEMPVEELLNVNETSATERTRLERMDSFSDSVRKAPDLPVKIFRAAHATSVTF